MNKQTLVGNELLPHLLLAGVKAKMDEEKFAHLKNLEQLQVEMKRASESAIFFSASGAWAIPLIFA